MSLFLGSIYSTMELDTGKLSGQVASAQRSLTGLGDSAENIGGRSQTGFGQMVKASALGNLAAIGLAKGVQGITSAVGESFTALTGLQNARASFESLTGSADNASKVMKDLANYANSTPFEFGKIAAAGKTLLGFGSGVDQVGGQMRMLGDVAGATGGDLGSIARVFGQVQAAGKLTAEDFNQLIDNGVAVGDVLSKQMGIPMSQLREEMSKGNISFDVFNKAMQSSTTEGGKFFGGAEKLSQTLTGRLSTLKDTITGMVGTFVGVDFSSGVVKAGGAFDMLSNGIKSATTWLSANKATIEAVAAAVGGGLIVGITGVAKAIGGMIGFIADWVRLFREGNPLVQGLTIFIGGLALGLGAYMAVVKTVTAVTKAWTAVTAAWGVVSKTALIGPVGLVIVIIAALIAVGYLVVKNWDTIKAAATTVLGAAWETIKSGLTSVKNFFIGVWDSIVSFMGTYGATILAVIAPIIGIPLLIYQHWGTITAFFSNLWTTITTAFSAGVTAVGNWVSNLWTTVTGFFGRLWSDITSGVAAGIGAVVGFFAGLPGKIMGWLTDLWNREVAFWTMLWNWTRTTVTNGISAIVSFFSQLPGRIMGAISAVAGTIRDAFTNAFNMARNAVSSGIDGVIGFVRGIPGKITGAVGNLGSLLNGAGKQVIEGFINGIKNMFGNVQSTLGDLTKKLTSWKGPARTDAMLLQGAGQLVIGGFITGLESQYSATRRSLEGFTNSLGGTVDTSSLFSATPYSANASMAGSDYPGNPSGAGGAGSTYNISLPNVTEPADFAREFKLAKAGL